MFDDADEAIARVEQDVRRAQRRAQQMGRLQQVTAATRGMARRTEVTVEVDHTGRLTELRIADSALSRGGAGVARLILETVRLARRDLQRNLLTEASDLLGEDDPVLAVLRAQLETEPVHSGAARVGLRARLEPEVVR